jgi:hypothetical protein
LVQRGLEPGGPRRAQAQHPHQFVHAGPPQAGDVTESSPDAFYAQQHIRDLDPLRAVLATLKRFMQEY